MSSGSAAVTLQPSDTALTTAIVSDALDKVGCREHVLHRSITPLIPGSRLLGRAATVHFVPSSVDSASPYDEAIAFIDTLTGGDVAVVATDANSSAAYWGELFSAAAIGRGAVGVITDGPIRDAAKIQSLGFPTFCAGHLPLDFRGRMRIESVGDIVVVGGLTIHPGELILADDDGVVVIPRDVETDVITLARERAAAETIVLGQLLGGASLRHVWDTYHVL
jgi:4-hydroxy-4-methyl-2-oxoglutarate aldolase